MTPIVKLPVSGSYPESNPPSNVTQGLSNVDCVIEWFPDSNRKTIESPTFALTEEGLKVDCALAKTVCVEDEAPVATGDDDATPV